MSNEVRQAGTNAQQSTNVEVSTSSPNNAKPYVGRSAWLFCKTRYFIYWVKCRLGLRCYILQKDSRKSVENIRLPHASRFQKGRFV